jgi:transcription initiation factor TFIIIB Brf1 subunit/transcription initiation factor TFIIB
MAQLSHPAGFAAACLYNAGREEGRWLTQSEAADVANASTTTIRNHLDTLQQLDDEFTDKPRTTVRGTVDDPRVGSG